MSATVQAASATTERPCQGQRPSLAAWKSLFMREMQTVLLNRFVPVFSLAALAVGSAPLFGEHPGRSAPYFLIQAVLYLIPLFALLIGVGAAQGDIEERPFLFSQPVGRLTMVLGKWLALLAVLFLAATLLVLPTAFGTSASGAVAILWVSTLETGAVFLALGMAVGYTTNDRVKAHLGVLCLWLLLLAGFDLLALFAAQAGLFHQAPAFWLPILMLNPLAAFRIGTLFSLGQVPLDLTQIPALGRWWLSHPLLWLGFLTTAWTVALLGWCRLRLHRMED